MAAKASPASAPTTDQSLGDQVIDLRSAGKSFAAIATSIGVERKLDAFRLLLEGIAGRKPAEQKKLRAAEAKRLDILEARARENTDEAARDRTLASIGKLRQQIAGAAKLK